MKIYARQVSPEQQESPLFLGDEFFPEDIAVFGNRDFVERLPDVVRRVRDVLSTGELSEVLEDIERGDADPLFSYATASEAVTDMLPPENRRRYNSSEVHALKMAVLAYTDTRRSIDKENALCAALSVVTGHKWEHRQISGCVQCEWNEVFYPADDWSREALSAFEVEYFNNGTEWIIHDGDEKPESPEYINGYSFYATAWDTEDIRKAIADEAGATPADVVLYEYKGERIAPIYCEV